MPGHMHNKAGCTYWTHGTTAHHRMGTTIWWPFRDFIWWYRCIAVHYSTLQQIWWTTNCTNNSINYIGYQRATKESGSPTCISEIQESLLRCRSTMITKTPTMGSQNWSNTRKTNEKNLGLQANPTGKSGVTRIYYYWITDWLPETFGSPRCMLLFLYRQKGWKIMTCTRLSSIKWYHSQECHTNTLNSRASWQVTWRMILHKTRCPMGLQ